MGIVERVKVVLGIEDRASSYVDFATGRALHRVHRIGLRHQVIDAAANLTGLALSRAKVNVSGDMARLWGACAVGSGFHGAAVQGRSP